MEKHETLISSTNERMLVNLCRQPSTFPERMWYCPLVDYLLLSQQTETMKISLQITKVLLDISACLISAIAQIVTLLGLGLAS